MDILKGVRSDIRLLPYDYMEKGSGNTVVFEGNTYSISVIGHHNLQNMAAARLVCNCLDIQNKAFLQAISSFRGAAKRLQLLQQSAYRNIFLDFAHAPSKVVATTGAVKEWYGTQKLLAVLELHTFSSLNKDFISQYHQSLDAADKAIVFYNEHTLQMKGMPALEADWIVSAFGRPDLVIITDKNELKSILLSEVVSRYNILLMTSGNFNGLDYSELK
jgi:UDP-N-acetylmuramate: L-alanyl-gamma-D-glutamyl-meso-diaminopimelate ligase